MSKFNKLPYLIIVWQAVLVLVVSVVLLPFSGLIASYSAFAGGMISVIANLVFARRLFSDKLGWEIEQLTAVTYRGVIGKLILTMALFLMAVVFLKPLDAVALFAVFLMAQLSPALIVVLLNRT